MHHGTGHRASRQGKQTNLFKLLGHIFMAKIELNDDCALACSGTLKHE
jgi:hypothetical protein